jgi:hypothetical protein
MRWRCLGNGMDQLGNEDESMTNPKPYDIPKKMVLEAYRRVKANQGAAGIDGESLEMFEADLAGNLYKLWNRISSGSYFPLPVKQVEIPKKNGGVRSLGVPTATSNYTYRQCFFGMGGDFPPFSPAARPAFTGFKAPTPLWAGHADFARSNARDGHCAA